MVSQMRRGLLDTAMITTGSTAPNTKLIADTTAA